MCMTCHAAFGAHPCVEHMLHSSLAGRVQEFRRMVIRHTLFFFMTVITGFLPVAAHARGPVQIRLVHVLLFHELRCVDLRQVTGVTLSARPLPSEMAMRVATV